MAAVTLLGWGACSWRIPSTRQGTLIIDLPQYFFPQEMN